MFRLLNLASIFWSFASHTVRNPHLPANMEILPESRLNAYVPKQIG